MTPANIFGLGWAATPAGLKAMEELQKLEKEREIQSFDNQKPYVRQEHVASDEMCTFLVLNISSLQLIPVNIIAYRSQYGSADSTGIVGPAIAATTLSTMVALLFCKAISRKKLY